MREILFRAKRKDNKKWSVGYYAIIGERNVIIKLQSEDYYAVDDSVKKSHGNEVIEVDPETVCQYTGLTDKNGRKIFEGDIVRRKIVDDYIIGQVVWFDTGFCGFHLKCGNRYYPIGKSEQTGISDCDEVIGNIFDNPIRI